jgi:hypothetical protein
MPSAKYNRLARPAVQQVQIHSMEDEDEKIHEGVD